MADHESAGTVRTGHDPLRSADPEVYDSPRAQRARDKGLPGAVHHRWRGTRRAAGTRRGTSAGALARAMVAVIVAAGFVLGVIVALLVPSVVQ